jgi:DNA-nicking Smr family endonuclease
MQTTLEDLRRLVGVLENLIEPLMEGDVVEDAPYESMKRPHLVFQEGSKTYGRAYRVHFTGGSKYGSGHWEPRGFSDYLGMTKAEAEQSLRKLFAGIHTGLLIAEKKEAKA